MVIHISKIFLRYSGEKYQTSRPPLHIPRANSILLKTFPKNTLFAPIVNLKKRSHNDLRVKIN